MRYLIGLITGFALLSSLSAADPSAVLAAKSATPRSALIAHFEPIIEPYEQIFPAFEIASQGLNSGRVRADSSVFGQANALIGAQVSATQANLPLTLEISAVSLLAPSRIKAVLPKAGKRYMLYPDLNWLPGALERVQMARSVEIRFRLSSGEKVLLTQNKTVRVRPTNEVLYGVREQGSNKVLDFNWLFAAFVDRNSPAVDQILSSAKRGGLVEQFDGYAGADEEQIYAQIFAIWHVLQSRGIRYSNLPPPKESRHLTQSQYVRFVDDTWRQQAANCVDGSVLIASALERIGLRPVLVVLPGHMLLGVALDQHGERFAYLETTRLGQLPRGVKSAGELSMQQSFKIFERALAEGERQVNQAGAAFERPDDWSYQLIDILAARRMGVLPIRPGVR